MSSVATCVSLPSGRTMQKYDIILIVTSLHKSSIAPRCQRREWNGLSFSQVIYLENDYPSAEEWKLLWISVIWWAVSPRANPFPSLSLRIRALAVPQGPFHSQPPGGGGAGRRRVSSTWGFLQGWLQPEQLHIGLLWKLLLKEGAPCLSKMWNCCSRELQVSLSFFFRNI